MIPLGVMNADYNCTIRGVKMVEQSYESLSSEGKNVYREIIRQIGINPKEFVFYNIPYDNVKEAFNAIYYDHPEYFWYSGAGRASVMQCSTSTTVKFSPEITFPLYSLERERALFNNKVYNLISKAKLASPVLYEQVLFIHDRLVADTEYVTDAPHCYDAYGCLVLGQAVCEGYSEAFQVLMHELGVECGRAYGKSASKRTGEGNHEWNYIKLSDGYYYVDVTWDDPIVKKGENSNDISHDFFCIDYNEMLKDHIFSSDCFYPKSCGTKYEYYRYHGMYLDIYYYEDVKRIATKQLMSSDRVIVKFGSQLQLERAMDDLLNNNKVFSLPGFSRRLKYGVNPDSHILTLYARLK